MGAAVWYGRRGYIRRRTSEHIVGRRRRRRRRAAEEAVAPGRAPRGGLRQHGAGIAQLRVAFASRDCLNLPKRHTKFFNES